MRNSTALAILAILSFPIGGCLGAEEPAIDGRVIQNPCLDTSDCNDHSTCTRDQCILLECKWEWINGVYDYCARPHCDRGETTDEVCDGIDNNCNDWVDENLDCPLPDNGEN
jgi:hypothetical protein